MLLTEKNPEPFLIAWYRGESPTVPVWYETKPVPDYEKRTTEYQNKANPKQIAKTRDINPSYYLSQNNRSRMLLSDQRDREAKLFLFWNITE